MRHRHLPGLWVGPGHHGGVGHRRVGAQQRLQLGRGHLGALVLDELLEPVDHEQVAVGVDVAEVAGAQPAAGSEGGRRRLRPVAVAAHHLGAAHPQLPCPAGAEVAAAERVDDGRPGTTTIPACGRRRTTAPATSTTTPARPGSTGSRPPSASAWPASGCPRWSATPTGSRRTSAGATAARWPSTTGTAPWPSPRRWWPAWPPPSGRRPAAPARPPPLERMGGGGPQLDRLAAEVAERAGRAGA
jgi:hypothetical protein